MKHVVSVSLGSSKRDTDQQITLLGERVRIERRGMDGDFVRAGEVIRELDGKVDAIGLGGLDIYLYVGKRRYTFTDGMRLAREATSTPVVCGAGLKDSLERTVVRDLDAALHWQDKRVLMVSAVDRFGMAEALAEAGAAVRYGDFIFLFGLPLPLTSPRTLQLICHIIAPVATKFPIDWIYPTGDKQETGEPKHQRHYDWAEVIAGDWHWIRRYAPARLDGKVILTNTTTQDDVAFLRARGARTLITTTPRFEGRSLSTNLLEAALVAVSGRFPLDRQAYQELMLQAQLEPTVLELQQGTTPEAA